MKPLTSIGEQVSVDTSNVDAIGGAKPEPEERPAFVHTTLDPTSGDRGDLSSIPEDRRGGVVPLVPKMPPVVREELSVNELASMLGHTCSNCKHFNHPLGQSQIELEMKCGTPEQMDRWRATIAEIAMRNPELAGEEFVSDPFAELPAEREILKLGLCLAMSEPGFDKNVFSHPDTFCPSEEMTGEDLFRPRTREIAQAIQQQRDRLLGTANVNAPSLWGKIKLFLKKKE